MILISLVANRDFRLIKTSGWDSVALERVEESTKEGRGAEIGAVVCGEGEMSKDLSFDVAPWISTPPSRSSRQMLLLGLAEVEDLRPGSRREY